MEVSLLYCLKIDVGVCLCLSRAMIITGCAIELEHSVLSRAMIITRPAHKVSKYAADFCGLLVVSCYDRLHINQ
jgi:hypothetical protein